LTVDVTGLAVPRFSRTDITRFTLEVLRTVKASSREVSIAFVEDAAMKRLNKEFRGKNKTTDVLTFPSDDSYAADIVISLDQARRQARDEKHSLATEVRYLILHGVLHALGYDHETDNGEMDELEVAVREKVGLD